VGEVAHCAALGEIIDAIGLRNRISGRATFPGAPPGAVRECPPRSLHVFHAFTEPGLAEDRSQEPGQLSAYGASKAFHGSCPCLADHLMDEGQFPDMTGISRSMAAAGGDSSVFRVPCS
jgi:hypothetical protein